jgi:predicted HAD superfamily Cof-like phosphohydrolase
MLQSPATQETHMREQQMVMEFHNTFEVHAGNPADPKIVYPELRIALVNEEAAEFQEAVKRGDLIETIDAMCDLMYVVLGAAVTFGIDLAPFFAEVHRSNMSKVGGHKREDGKWVKPPTYSPANLAPTLAQQIRNAISTQEVQLASKRASS